MIYGDIHRFFLRTIMNKGVLPRSEAEAVLRKHSEWSDHNLKDVVNLINSQIRPLQQEVKITSGDVSAAIEVVFISTGEGESAKAASPHSAPELDFFRRVLEAIATSDDKSITGIAALNLTSQVELRAVTKQRGQELLDIWCKSHYLNKSESFGYILGTRGILEFEHYLKDNLPDTVDDCHLCKKTVFQPYRWFRVREHVAAWRLKKQDNSTFANHLILEDHVFSSEKGIKMLHSNTDSHKLFYQELLEINKAKINGLPILNDQSVCCDKCGESFHSACLKKFLERIVKWPCCKAVYEPQSESTLMSQESSQATENISIDLEDDISQEIDFEEPTTSNSSPDQNSRKRKRNI